MFYKIRLESNLLMQAKCDMKYEERVDRKERITTGSTVILGCFLWMKLF